ncbi:hypothetical protein BKA70DRAFT_1337543 [Coprinopsis sp. MPI-PUGE-AT-0042]|nr:hypothetical protein BKA70DRAFT_1337543 [Coprinopsis sp. MPI-PUGE-AT-0042]
MLPDAVLVQIDKYVDSLAPQIQPRIASEIDEFQTKTLDSLEDQIVKAFRSLFDKGSSNPNGSRDLDDSPPDAYGVGSLPFGNEIASLTRSFSFDKMADGASDDLRELFDLTEGNQGGNTQSSRGFNSDSFSQGAKGFLSAAVGALADHSQRPGGSGGGQPDFMDGLLGVLSKTVKDASQNPEEKARLISPEIKEKLGVTLREQHAPLADQFTRIALDHIKKWLRGNTSNRDMGDALKGEISGLVTGLAGMFGKKSQPDQGSGSRGIGDRAGGDGGGDAGTGFSRVISDKLSTGLAKVHREVRLEFRSVLGGIEKQLFEALPDKFQGPLEKILGGNPFDPSLDSKVQTQGSRGFADDIKTKVVDKIRQLVRKVQEALRESILSVVNGGHRKFERSSWVFVQNMVEVKVQKFLPDVRITVPDDIGNEGVSVGKPQGLGSAQPPEGQRSGQPSNAGNPAGYQSQPQQPPPQSSYQQAPPPSSSYPQQPPRDQSYDRPPPGNPPSGHGGKAGYNPSYEQAPSQYQDQGQKPHGNPHYGGQHAPPQGQSYNQTPSYGQDQQHGEAQSYYNQQPSHPQGQNQYYN